MSQLLQIFTRDIDGLPSTSYSFNGVDSYATIPAWTPLGLPYEVRLSALPLTVADVNRYPISGEAMAEYMSLSTAAAMAYFRPVSSGSANTGSAGASVSVGETQNVVVEFIPDQFNLTLNGVPPTTIGGVTDLGVASNLKQIAVHNNLAQGFFHGPIWNLYLTDNSPIQDTVANMGNLTRYGELDEKVVLTTDFDISVDVISKNELVRIIYGKDIADTFSITTADNAVLSIGGNFQTFTGAMTDVADGQHINMRLVRISNQVQLFIDGVAKGAGTFGLPFEIGFIGANFNGTQAFPVGAAIQNIRITDTTNSNEWLYTLDEGSGLLINNTGTTQGNYLNQPLWDTTANFGNGTRYGTIPQINIPANDDYEMSFDFIRPAAAATITKVFGDAANTWNIQVGDTDYTSPNMLILRKGGANASVGALTGSTAGDHIAITLRRTGGVTEGFLNGVSIGTVVDTTAVPINELYRSGGNAVKANSAIQNIDIQNTTTGERWFFPLDEGSGTVITNTDPTTGQVGAEIWVDTPDAIGVGWSVIGANDYACDGTQVADTLIQTNGTPTTGTVWLVEFEVYDYASGIVYPRISNKGGTVRSADGIYSETITATDSFPNGWRINGDASFVGKVRNVSFKAYPNGEWTPDTDWQAIGPYSNDGAWTPDTDWVAIANNSRYYPMDDGTATLRDALNRGPEIWTDPADILNNWVYEGAGVYSLDGTQIASENLEVNYTSTVGATYRCSVEIITRTAGGLVISVGGATNGAAFNSVGVHTFDIVAVNTDNPLVQANSVFAGSVGSISFIELLSGTNTDGTIINYTAAAQISAGVRVDEVGAVDHFANGLPATAEGKLAIDTTGAITHHHQGLGFTAESKLAMIYDGVVDHFGSGAAPMDSTGRLVMTVTGPAESYLSSVPYVDSRVLVTDL